MLKDFREDLFQEIHPTLNQGIEVDALAAYSNKKIWWICELGHEWESSVSNRNNRGCPYCGNKKVMAGFNDLVTLHPSIAEEWSNKNTLKPNEVLSGSHGKYFWTCKDGHEWEASVVKRTMIKRGCPYCTLQKRIIGVNDLASVNPKLLSEWHPNKNMPLKPEDVGPSGDIKVWWIAECGHEWKATVGSRHTLGAGCPSCAPLGFINDKPSYLYLISNQNMEAMKIGITNVSSPRLSQWEKLGWVIIKTWEADGNKIRALENETLKWIRHELKLSPVLKKSDLPKMAGWRETFSINSGFNDKFFIKYIDELFNH